MKRIGDPLNNENSKKAKLTPLEVRLFLCLIRIILIIIERLIGWICFQTN
jgi:hypothetical protein